MDKYLIYTLVIAAVSLCLTIIALIDIILKDFGSVGKKVLWHFIALIPIIGWVVYLVFGSKKGKKIT